MAVARRDPIDAPLLTLRELNRALLARQMLLRRERVPIVTAVERLGALQAQFAPAPYVALWSRLEGFSIADLERALATKKVVKATLMRGTLHICSARDFHYLGIAVHEARQRTWATTEKNLMRWYASATPAARKAVRAGAGIGDPVPMHAKLLRFTVKPRSRKDLIGFLTKETRLPTEVTRHLIWSFVATFGGLVHAPPSGTWAYRRSGELIAAGTYLGRSARPTVEAAVAHAVKRHLAAFGPATADDISSWTAIRTPPIRDAITALGRSVTGFRAENGAILYDLTASPRPPADTEAPVRFLPKWDSTLLAYSPADRVRILPEMHRRAVIIKNGDVAQTFLVDGVVAGTWSTERSPSLATLTLRPFGKLARATRSALEEEGEALTRFVAPGSRSYEVVVGAAP